MNKTSITLGVLASMMVGTTLPLDQNTIKQFRSSTKKKGSHLIQCLKGKESCTKTDFAIFGVTLLLARSSFHAALSVGTHTFKRSHTVDLRADHRSERKSTAGIYSKKISEWLEWGPGHLPQKLLDEARMRWSKGTKHKNKSGKRAHKHK